MSNDQRMAISNNAPIVQEIKTVLANARSNVAQQANNELLVYNRRGGAE